MQQVVDVQTMRESDAETIRGGISGRELMTRAARGILEGHAWRGKVAIVCGAGNNAGDGFALALLLHARKIDCRIYLLSDRFSSDGAYFYEKCKEIGIETVSFSPDETFTGYTEIVDCIFGTGFRGEVSGLAKSAIEAINRSGAFVVSADINSGLDGDSGLSALCVKSDLTVSIGSYKSGHFLGMAKDVIGKLTNVDIGIEIRQKTPMLFEKEDVRAALGTRREHSHKGSYGYVSILGGCREYAGAIKLAGMSCSALRAGCGVAQLIIPECIYPAVSPYLLESTAAPLPDLDGHIRFDADAIDRVLAKQSALAIGMGWGRSPENALILRHILTHYKHPVVIDADGLNTLSEMGADVLRKATCPLILTPHPKEMERISGIPLKQILEDPIGIAEEFARRYGVCVLLKGTATVVTDGNETYLVNRGCAGMATAGSGDVLSGVLAGLLGYASPNAKTVAAGAWIAGRAGELAERAVNPISMLASDTVSMIASAISEVLGL